LCVGRAFQSRISDIICFLVVIVVVGRAVLLPRKEKLERHCKEKKTPELQIPEDVLK